MQSCPGLVTGLMGILLLSSGTNHHLYQLAAGFCASLELMAVGKLFLLHQSLKI